MATTADEGGLGHLNVDLVFIGVMKILVPPFHAKHEQLYQLP
jgi:hypothetical protein